MYSRIDLVLAVHLEEGEFQYTHLKWKLFQLSKLHEIVPSKSCMETTTAGWVDHLWTKRIFSSHPLPLLGKVKTAGQGCDLPCSSWLRRLKRQLKPWDSQLGDFFFWHHLVGKGFFPLNYYIFFLDTLKQNHLAPCSISLLLIFQHLNDLVHL